MLPSPLTKGEEELVSFFSSFRRIGGKTTREETPLTAEQSQRLLDATRGTRAYLFSACWHFKPVCGAESFAG